MMTALEKLRQDHPDWDEDRIAWNVEQQCPDDFKYVCEGTYMCDNESESGCKLCWNREISEEKENETMAESTSTNVDARVIDYETEIARLQNVIEDQKVEIRELHRINNRMDEELDALRHLADKYELVIHAVEALVGQKIIDLD